MEWTQEWKKEGLEEGLQKGRQEGGAEALQDLLLLQMEGRFGSVPKALRRQIKSIQDSEPRPHWTILASEEDLFP